MGNFRILEITTRERSIFFPQKRLLWIWWDLSFAGLYDKKEAEKRILKDNFVSERKIHSFPNTIETRKIDSAFNIPKEEKCLKRFCDRKATTHDGLCQNCKDRDYGF